MNYSLEMIITTPERHALLQLAGEDRKPWNTEGATRMIDRQFRQYVAPGHVAAPRYNDKDPGRR